MTDSAEIPVETRAGFTVIRPSARLGGMEADSLAAILEPLVRQKNPLILIDLTNVNYIGSRSIGVLLAARGEADRQKGRIILGNVTPDVARVLQLARLEGYFQIVNDVDEMLARSQRIIEQKERPSPGAPTGSGQ